MKNEVLINELELFLELVGNYEFAINQLKKIDDDIELLHISKSAKLEAFDTGYLPRYIEDKIGERPKDFSYYSPLRFVKPLKVQKSKELKKYDENKKEATQQYYRDFAEQRSEIQRRAESDFSQKLSLLNKEKKAVQLEIEKLDKQISSKELLPKRFIKSNSIRRMIRYLKEWRADSIKEAIATLCFEEELKQSFQNIDSRLVRLETNVQNFDESIKEEIGIRFDAIESSLGDLNDKFDELKRDKTHI